MTQIKAWNRYRGWHPELTLDVAAAPDVVGSALATGLGTVRFKVDPPAASGFTARLRDWWGVAFLDDLGATLTMTVTLSAAGAGTRVVVAIGEGGEKHKLAKKTAEGLTAGVRLLEGQGVGVTASDWTSAEP